MSTTTSDLQLFKYDTSTDGKEVFSISSALNANWDKIDSFASAIKSLSNLSTEGEKRFTDLENSIANKLEADVLLAENGYIKFNNLLGYSLQKFTFTFFCMNRLYTQYIKIRKFMVYLIENILKKIQEKRLTFYFNFLKNFIHNKYICYIQI